MSCHFIKLFKFPIKFISLCLLIALVNPSINAAEKTLVPADEPPKTLDELKAAIEKIRQDTHTPAVGIALVNKDGPYWIAGLGEANLEKHIKADENTMFRIGSVSKMFVALAVLKLVEEGKLHLNDKVHDLAPEIQYENQWEKTNPILLAHLLEHTTGWDDMHLAEYAYEAPDSLSLKEGLAYHPDSRKSRWIPGTRMSYCNTGPVVAAYIIEKITGKKFETYIQDNFFNPLQMTTTTYFENENYKNLSATLYQNNKPEKYWHFYGRPAGAINASPKEMANFLQLMIQRGQFNGNTILGETSIDRMEKPETSLGAQHGITAGYGLHNYTSGYKDYGIAFHGHNGGMVGGLTELSYISELQTGYVFMINSSNGAALAKISDALRNYLLKERKHEETKITKLPEKFQHLSGLYTPINYRNEKFRIIFDVAAAMKFSVSENFLHREPLLGGWEAPSKDYAVANNLLVNSWTGLPSIALVNDPLAGDTIAIEDSLFKRVSPIKVYGQLTLIALVVFLSICSILFTVIWIPRLAWGRLSGGVSIKIRIWPLATSLCLLAAIFSPQIFGSNFADFGHISITSVCIFLFSTLYPILAAYSLLLIYKNRASAINLWVYWSSTSLAIVHILFAVFLTHYELIGFRSWI